MSRGAGKVRALDSEGPGTSRPVLDTRRPPRNGGEAMIAPARFSPARSAPFPSDALAKAETWFDFDSLIWVQRALRIFSVDHDDALGRVPAAQACDLFSRDGWLTPRKSSPLDIQMEGLGMARTLGDRNRSAHVIVPIDGVYC